MSALLPHLGNCNSACYFSLFRSANHPPAAPPGFHSALLGLCHTAYPPVDPSTESPGIEASMTCMNRPWTTPTMPCHGPGFHSLVSTHTHDHRLIETALPRSQLVLRPNPQSRADSDSGWPQAAGKQRGSERTFASSGPAIAAQRTAGGRQLVGRDETAGQR